MKPKYHKIIRQLPLAIFVAGSMSTAQAAAILFTDDAAGNAQPTSADNGASTVVANGGTSSTPFVLISSGVSMTGFAAQPAVVVLSGAFPYLVTVNSGGSLAGSATHDGIQSSVVLTLNNSGIVSGSGGVGFQGVQTIGGSTLTNNSSGTISGTDDAITFTTAGGTVFNSGLIDGITGVASDGISGTSGVSVTNTGSGIIRGVANGINVTSGLTVTNGAALNVGTPVISSSAGNGILATSGAGITNYGNVTGFLHGISVTSGATINNNTSNDGFGNQFGGSITGGVGNNGVNATTGLNLTNENLSTITGGLNGVLATDGTVNNNTGATITGTTGAGVTFSGTANVTNGGTITGSTIGLRVGDASTATNTGTISGLVGIDAVGATTFLLNNSGTVTATGAGTAIDGILGVDTVNLNAKTIINGNILLYSGADNITLDSDAGNSVVVNGNIDGGDDTDVLTFVDGKTTVGGAVNIVNGNVTLFQDIIKNGSGTAFIGDVGTSRTVQTDAIHVNSGGLYINGNVGPTGLVLETVITVNGLLGSAAIGGTGTWDANITLSNGAGISPGGTPISIAQNVNDSVGTLTVTGDVTLDGTSFYRWDVNPFTDIPGTLSSSHDLIALPGAGNVFTVNGDQFRISPTNVNSPLQDGSRIVVDTDSMLVGSFGAITLSPFTGNTPDNGPFYANQINPILPNYFSTLTPVNGNTDWQLSIQHDYSQFGTTPNQVAAGNMLDALVPTATGDLADFLAALDYSDASVTEAALAALDPSQYFATASALASNNYRLHRAVETHNAAVRASSGTTLSSSGGSYSGKGGVVMSQTTSSGCGTTNVWGSASYDWQDFNADNGDFDSDGETGSFTAGIDFTIANNFRLGLVAEGSRSSWDGNGSDNGTDIDSYRFGLYANYGEATGWFVDALVGYNSHSIDQDRFIGLGGIGGPDSYNNSYDADGWQGFVNVGYAFETGAGLISPFIGLEWQQLSVDGISEDSLIGLDGYDVDSLRGLAGVKWEMAIGGSSALYATAAYAHEFEDSANDVTVHFGSGSYDAEGLDQGDSVLLSAGLRWSVTECTTVDIGYRGELGLDDNGLDSHGANVGVNFAF